MRKSFIKEREYPLKWKNGPSMTRIPVNCGLLVSLLPFTRDWVAMLSGLLGHKRHGGQGRGRNNGLQEEKGAL